MYEPRTYRHWISNTDLVSFDVALKETDLRIRARRNLRQKALHSVERCRNIIERYIEQHPAFLTTLQPFTPQNDVPNIIEEMSSTSTAVCLGPMASVAGAVAEFVGRDLCAFSEEVIVENGGDIFMKTALSRKVGIYAGNSPLSGTLALTIDPEQTPLGICTSSGTVGHSLSFGKADAAIILASSTALADATATAVGNLVVNIGDIEKGIKFAQTVNGIEGVVIIKDDKMGMWGNLKISKI